jgi:hypothetical protein
MIYTVEQIERAIGTLPNHERERLIKKITVDDAAAQDIAPNTVPQNQETDHVLIYDGGDEDTPPSFLLTGPALTRRQSQILTDSDRLGHEAEYAALIAGLEHLMRQIRETGQSPAQHTLQVRGNSRLVIQQLNGLWQPGSKALRDLRDRAQGLLAQFEDYYLEEISSAQLAKVAA